MTKEKDLFEENNINEEVKEMELEMDDLELELDGEEVIEEIEEIVAEKVKKEEKENQENKHKRGPKKGSTRSTKKEENGEKPAAKKEEKLNFKDENIIIREIKKGRLPAPCFRIEKNEEDKTYDLLEANGIIFSGDAKYEKYDNEKVMVRGKMLVTLKAAELYGDTFKVKHKNDEEVEHDFVRVELHKPGRERDVVEVYSVREMKSKFKVEQEKMKKKEEEKKKKEEKAKKEKEEASKAEEKENKVS